MSPVTASTCTNAQTGKSHRTKRLAVTCTHGSFPHTWPVTAKVSLNAIPDALSTHACLGSLRAIRVPSPTSNVPRVLIPSFAIMITPPPRHPAVVDSPQPCMSHAITVSPHCDGGVGPCMDGRGAGRSVAECTDIQVHCTAQHSTAYMGR